jgi:hypothetical protein
MHWRGMISEFALLHTISEFRADMDRFEFIKMVLQALATSTGVGVALLYFTFA